MQKQNKKRRRTLVKKVRRTREAGVEKETLTASEKFQLIEKTIRVHQLKCELAFLCSLANVSRSGYYAWLQATDTRQKREESDELEI